MSDPDFARRFAPPAQVRLEGLRDPSAAPAPESPFGLVYERVWRPRIEALKFVEGYRAAWGRLESDWGPVALRENFEAYRRAFRDPATAPPTATPEARRLAELTVFLGAISIGPVDPDNPADAGLPPAPELGALDPLGYLGSGGVILQVIAERPVPPPTAQAPYCLAVIDLSLPDSTIAEDLRRLRDVYGVPRTRRPKRKRSWAEFARAFEMIRVRQKEPRETWARIARRFHVGSPDDEKGAARSAWKIVAEAKRLIQEMAAAYAASRPKYDVPPPPPGPLRRTTL